MITQLKFDYNGTRVLLHANDYHIVSEMMKEKSFYEHWLLEFIQKNFSGGLFVDIGANTGNHSIFFGLFCDCKVLSFEPLKESANLLRINIVDNNLEKKIRVAEYAVSNQSGKTFMTIPDSREQSIGGAHIGSSGQEIEMSTLDDLLVWQEEKITLMKIDVEGNELKVVQGAMKTITKHLPELFIEVFEQGRFNDIQSLLTPLGYEMKERYCHAPVYHFSTNKNIKRTFT